MDDTRPAGARTALYADEQLRFAALTVACARYPNLDLRTQTELADAIGEYISSGKLPPAEPGTSY